MANWIGFSAICFLFLLLIWPVIASRSIFFTRKPEPTLPPGERNNNEIARQRFNEFLQDANKDMCIVSGSLYPYVYDEKTVKNVRARLNGKSRLRIRILVGPTIDCRKELGDNDFWKLYESKEFGERFQIRVLSSYPEEHFRVVDSVCLFREDGHERGEENRVFLMNMNSFVNAPVFASHFNDAWSKVDASREPEFQLVKG